MARPRHTVMQERRLAFPKPGILLSVLMVGVFFEPMCLHYIDKAGLFEPTSGLIGLLFSIGQAAATLLAFAWAWRDYPSEVNPEWLILLLAMVALVLPAFINDSIKGAISEAFRCATYFGIMLTIFCLSRYDRRSLATALVGLFLFFTACNVTSIGLAITGHLPAVNEATIYFFGGKNSIFIGGVPLVASLAWRDYLLRGRLSFSPSIAAAFYAICAIVVQSLSSSICFFVLAGFLLLLVSRHYPAKVLSLPLLLAIVAVVFCILVLFHDNRALGPYFDLIGRSPTFSGRDYLWLQAKDLIAGSPLTGNGSGLEYTLRNGTVTSHPHSFYLQYCAQYGLPFMILFLLDLVIVAFRTCHGYPSVGTAALSVCLFILLFHSMFDIISLKLYFMLRMLLECSMKQLPLLEPFISLESRMGRHAEPR